MILGTTKLMKTFVVDDCCTRVERVKSQKGSEGSVGKKKKEGGHTQVLMFVRGLG